MSASRPEYGVHLEADVGVEMRDGVTLSTDIYFPARDGKPLAGRHPAVLHRTPYHKSQVEEATGFCRWFARRGYVALIQDIRGAHKSGGDANFFLPEAEDGEDMLRWLADQPWSNGKVGTWGISRAGWTQTAMAAMGPGNLATMVPAMSGSDAHSAGVRQGGAFELRIMAGEAEKAALNTQAKLKADPWIDPALNLGAPRFADWLSRMPIRKGQTPLKLVPPYENFIFELFTRSDRDDYWNQPAMSPARHWDRFPDIPILIVGGWYDSYTRGAFENFLGLSGRKKGPIRLLMGPWTHGTTTIEQSHAGDVEFGEEAALESFRGLHLRWFDRWLKGVRNGLDEEPPLRLFVMGGGGGARTTHDRLLHGGRWRGEREWPLARTRFTSFYLHADGALRADPSEAAESSTTYRFDPARPVPSIGGNVSSLRDLGPLPPGIADPALVPRQARHYDIMKPGGYDQVERPDAYGCAPPYLPLGARSDVLVFQTEPLAEDTEVTGPVEVKLWVSSGAADTDFTAKLIDLYPPSPWYPMGYALNLTDSILRLRYARNPDRAEPVPPGEIVQATIILYPTSNLFAAGHCIRLDISSSNFPRFDVNPNTGEPLGRNRRQVPADNTVHHDAARPSHIVLPLVPA